MKSFIIIGGGASGSVAAITAKRNNPNLNVTIIEKQSSILKKILQTGNGRCNLSNEEIKPEYYYGDKDLAKEVIQNFTSEECKAFFKSIGLFTTTEEGRIYPLSMTASSVREVLLNELERLNIKIKTDEQVKDIKIIEPEHRVKIITDKNEYKSDYVLISTGGKVGPGCDGDGYRFVKNLGMKYEPISPALVQMTTKEDTTLLKGVKVRGTITLKTEDKKFTESGEILFADYGISGIATMQLASPLNDALKQSQQTEITIDLTPDISTEELSEFLLNTNNSEMSQKLQGILNQKLIDFILKDENDAENIIKKIKSFTLTPTGTKLFKHAQVTHGGVPKTEVNTKLESNKNPGIFISGELLNVDGICGGYNLHFAWGSGITVGLEVGERAKN